MRHELAQYRVAEHNADQYVVKKDDILLIKRSRLPKRVFSGLVWAMLATGLSGCMIVDSPIKGMLGTEVIWGDIATANKASPVARGPLKEGKACAESILGLLARGDASVRAAKAKGQITEVTTVDHSARNILNIVGEWCTIVKGY